MLRPLPKNRSPVASLCWGQQPGGGTWGHPHSSLLLASIPPPPSDLSLPLAVSCSLHRPLPLARVSWAAPHPLAWSQKGCPSAAGLEELLAPAVLQGAFPRGKSLQQMCQTKSRFLL